MSRLPCCTKSRLPKARAPITQHGACFWQTDAPHRNSARALRALPFETATVLRYGPSDGSGFHLVAVRASEHILTNRRMNSIRVNFVLALSGPGPYPAVAIPKDRKSTRL